MRQGVLQQLLLVREASRGSCKGHQRLRQHPKRAGSSVATVPAVQPASTEGVAAGGSTSCTGGVRARDAGAAVQTLGRHGAVPS